MNPHQRPKGLKETAVLMSITNALGWAIIDWPSPRASAVFVEFTVVILVGYFVTWFYWKGRNWARTLVLLTSLLSIYNLRYFSHSGITKRVMIGTEALLAVFLWIWLNTRDVKAFFHASRSVSHPTPS